MDKHNLSETDICEKFISPALARAGWDVIEQLLREYPLRPGRRVVRGQRASRDVKAAGFNLDQKKPHAGPEVSHDPEALLAEYRPVQSEAQAIRDRLKAILAQTLEGRP